MRSSRRGVVILLGAAVLVGLLARLPGVWWGANFPPGWYGHHPDEYTHVLHTQLLINWDQPRFDPETSPAIGLRDPWAAGFGVTPYPKGLAVHIAAPVVASRVATGVERSRPPPPPSRIIPPGRVVSVLYGTATVVVAFLLAQALFSGTAVPLMAAWLMALGGLHVTQSHFFLADVPALFWMLLGTLLLWWDLKAAESRSVGWLAGAAFCLGVAFGLKLMVAALPSLGLAALLKGRRLIRVGLAAVAFLVGMLGVNYGSYTPMDFIRTVQTGIADPYEFSKLTSAFLYILQLPSILGLPLTVAAVWGAVALTLRLVRSKDRRLQLRATVVAALPLVVHATMVFFQLDHFPRHLLPFVPWLVLAGAWGVVRASDRVQSRWGAPRLALPVAVLLWQAVFVFDGERGFIDDPRNEAAEWIYENVPDSSTYWWYYHYLPGYPGAGFPSDRPDFVVEEMIHANHYLSGVGLRGGFPRDPRYVFDVETQEQLDAFQGLFTGESGYHVVARFGVDYFMPEYTLTDRLVGDRSRSYLTEVVIFAKDDAVGGG